MKPGHPSKWIAVLAMVLIGGVGNADANETLSGSTLKKTLPGNYTLVVYGFDVRVSATSGGGFSLKAFGEQLKGRWSVKGKTLCLSFKDDGKTKTECSQVTYDGKKWYTAGGLSFYQR